MDPYNQKPGTPAQPGQIPSSPDPQDPQNPYHFILNAPKAPKQPLFKTGSLRSKLFVIIGGAFIVILAIVLISSLLSRSSKTATTELITIVAQQQEIIRVANLGIAGSASDLPTQVWAATTESSVSSQQQRLIKYLKQKDIIVLPEQLNAKLSKKTDADFKTATVNSTFVSTFKDNLRSSLVAYGQDLSKSYKNVSSPEIKTLLNESYKNTVTLLKEK